MNLKEIKKLDPERARFLLRFELVGGKAWGGRLCHTWLTDRLTLCGEALTRHRYGHYMSAQKNCPRCQKLRKAIKARAEGVQDDQER